MEEHITLHSKPKVINKLILVGNGFDLSLGLQTRYEDFLLWYLKKFVVKFLESKEPFKNEKGKLIYSHNEDELFSLYNTNFYIYEDEHVQSFKKDMDSYNKIKNYIFNGSHKLTHHFKSNLLEKILKSSIQSWVDIEHTYFKLLKECVNEKKIEITILNNELHQLKVLLHEYLSQLNYSNSKESRFTFHYGKQFSKPIEKTEIIEPVLNKELIVSEKIFFLNFNYTNTITNVINSSMFNCHGVFKEVIVSQIHSSLKDAPESLVFGYGDEMDLEYKKIEELNDNSYFQGIKSFKYSENSKYRDLLRFLNSDDYQVLIYGHSCGLSDRVMLNEIFEHERCKSIKICYYDKKEFVNKTMDISRHFTNNQMMRKKIVEFNEEDVMPQFSSFIQ
ncbi:AbiH family protein [Olleya namhaensis]|uniref:AbiH family protein n=1 Tax=Olleya namhaensis TaxID=1144750 RepID=UPI002491A400|nr:AbiH family protein [Olleya namhaensis]